jgi:hypothetical protein
MKAIGFIGLGTMGEPMAANLLRKGYPVTVYNRTAGKDEELVKLGADVAATPAGLAKAVDVVITMISNDAAIEDVFFGTDGVRFRRSFRAGSPPKCRTGFAISSTRPSREASLPRSKARSCSWPAGTRK